MNEQRGGSASEPVSEGGGRRGRNEEGDVAAAAAVATVSPVSWLLLAWQAGGDRDRERERGDGGARWSPLYFILEELLSSVRRRKPQARSGGVDGGIRGLPAVSTGGWYCHSVTSSSFSTEG